MLLCYTPWKDKRKYETDNNNNNENSNSNDSSNNSNNTNNESSITNISPPDIVKDFKVVENSEYTYLESYQPYKVTYFDRLLTFRFVERAVMRPSLSQLQTDPSLTNLGWYSATPTGSSSTGSLHFSKRFGNGSTNQIPKAIENTKQENNENKEKEKEKENKENLEPEKLVGLKRWLPVGLKQKLIKQSSALSFHHHSESGTSTPTLSKSISKESVNDSSNNRNNVLTTVSSYKPLSRFNMELIDDNKERLFYQKYVDTCSSIVGPPFELQSPQLASYYNKYIKTVNSPELPSREAWKISVDDTPLVSVPSFPMSLSKNNLYTPQPSLSSQNNTNTTLSSQDQASLLYYAKYCKQTSDRLFFVDDESRSLYHRYHNTIPNTKYRPRNTSLPLKK